ncbi:sugar phosphate isomerase/epimerase [bacterium]|nr:sugar phosphate isomerase/epimerase [bacterium]
MQLAAITHHAPTAPEGIRALGAAGATAVEIFLASKSHFDPTDPAQVEQVKQALAETGLTPAVAHLCFGPSFDISTPEEAVRERILEALVHEMRVAAGLGCITAILHPASRCEDPKAFQARLLVAAQSLKQLMPVAEDLGLDIAVENMLPRNPGAHIEDLLALLEAVPSPRLGFCCDTGHAFITGVPVDEMIRGFGDRLFAVHWQDNDGSGDQHVIPGKGAMAWEPFYEGLEAVGYSRPITLEATNGTMILSEFVRLAQLALDERRGLYV